MSIDPALLYAALSDDVYNRNLLDDALTTNAIKKTFDTSLAPVDPAVLSEASLEAIGLAGDASTGMVYATVPGDGFATQILQDGNNNYSVIFRGTDFGDGNVDLTQDAVIGLGSACPFKLRTCRNSFPRCSLKGSLACRSRPSSRPATAA